MVSMNICVRSGYLVFCDVFIGRLEYTKNTDEKEVDDFSSRYRIKDNTRKDKYPFCHGVSGYIRLV